jgi:hypothetical protein
MPAIHAGMRDAAKNGELVAALLENLQIEWRGIAGPGLIREKMLVQEAKIIANCQQPAWRSGRFSFGSRRQHGIEQRQRKHHACTA